MNRVADAIKQYGGGMTFFEIINLEDIQSIRSRHSNRARWKEELFEPNFW